MTLFTVKPAEPAEPVDSEATIVVTPHRTRYLVAKAKKATKTLTARGAVYGWRDTFTVAWTWPCGHRHEPTATFESAVKAFAAACWALEAGLCPECLLGALTAEQRLGIAYLPADHPARKDPSLIAQPHFAERQFDEQGEQWLGSPDPNRNAGLW